MQSAGRKKTGFGKPESIAIAVIVLFAVLLGFIQEYRAERAIEALRQMAAPTASILGDGAEVKIPARELVPGDVIILHTDDRMPADARLLEAVNLQVEEAALTGGADQRDSLDYGFCALRVLWPPRCAGNKRIG